MTAVVRKLRSQQRERFHIAGHGQGSQVDGVKTHIADQMSGCLLCSFVVSAKDQVRRRFLSTSLEYRNQHLTGNRTEGGYHMAPRTLAAKASAPEVVCPMSKWVSSLLIGSEHVSKTLPVKVPAWASTSSTRVQ